MSIKDIMKKRARQENGHQEPEPEPTPILGTEAEIPEERKDRLADVIENLRKATEGSGTGGFNMNAVLSMDSVSGNVADVLQIPVGGKETDVYRMLERTRLTAYQKGLYSKAIWQAENGMGWGPLRKPQPQLGSWIVFLMRASVSVDGESLAVFERTVSSWERSLYQQEQQKAAQAARGLSS